jgi:hypothetical protein
MEQQKQTQSYNNNMIHQRNKALSVYLLVLLLKEALAFTSLLRSRNEHSTIAHQHQLLRFHPCKHDAISSTSLAMIGTGFTFNDGEQILVSVQKPLGLVLEQDPSDTNGAIAVVDIDPNGSAARAGVKVGDVLLAVQNVSVLDKELEDILGFIGGAPRVLNLRLLRDEKAE